MSFNKITLIGAGRVGEAAAQILARNALARELVLIGVRPGVAEGTALDLEECGTLFGFDVRIKGGTDLALMAGSDVLIISAGVARKPGMSRSDILMANLPVLDDIAAEALRSAPDALALIVTNPVDVLTWRFARKTGWPRARILGLSGVLDGARMAAFIARETGLSVLDVHTLVIGGHGETMVPLARFCSIGGIPLAQFMDEAAIARISARTRDGGAEILSLKKNSSAYDAPGAAIATIVDALAHDRQRLLACVCPLDGEYGEHGVALGVPAIIGARGVSRIVELPLDAAERAALARSAASTRAEIARMDS